MRSRAVGIIVLVLGILWAPLVAAQQPTKVPRVGYGATAAAIIIERRFAEEKLHRLPGLVAELVRLKVDVTVSSSTPAVRAAEP